MGVPALFRWLSKKYPKIISRVVEEQPRQVPDSDFKIPVDTTRPNPNGEEFDNLYLDMNGIVHPCSHPENRPPPETEEEMMLEIFKYTDRVVNMVRPRKLLLIAVDGVAPRAKMNQQRSRRFRSAQEVKEKDEVQAKVFAEMEAAGKIIDEAIKGKKGWDSNAITPGTPFMDILAASIRYWCTYKLNTDPGWTNLKVIISDSTVPGEGEHKIMEFIRSQRNSPDHDPNTSHVMYGLDADLIMLGLATHEPNFRVLREDVFAQENSRGCRICGQEGHIAAECQGLAKAKVGEFDEKSKPVEQKPFIWLHVNILREYLAAEMNIPGFPFRFDLERAIDDWVFMCFFVGNDFLPHLPSLEIRENGIDLLISIWKENLSAMDGYLTTDGSVNLDRVQILLEGISTKEDGIFRRRHDQEMRRNQNKRPRPSDHVRAMENTPLPRKVVERNVEQPDNIPLVKPGDAPDASMNKQLVNNLAEIRKANLASNKSAAQALKAEMQGNGTGDSAENPAHQALKRKAEDTDDSKDEENDDSVRLWESGYKARYYDQKFHVAVDNVEFRRNLMKAYVEGLCWVLLYYYQGCPSWTWFYPYHYAPFASDFTDLSSFEISFDRGSPFRPFDQLMGVLPAASKHNLPPKLQELMTSEDSEIIDFYPESFPIDLNGKKFAWQGVALLPFIEEGRLLSAIEKVLPDLSEDEKQRNQLGYDYLLFSDSHELFSPLAGKLYGKKAAEKMSLDPRQSHGLAGLVSPDPTYVPSASFPFPLNVESKEFGDIENDRTMSVAYVAPKSNFIHKSMLLRGIKPRSKVLTINDEQAVRNGGRGNNVGRPGPRNDGRNGPNPPWNGNAGGLPYNGYPVPPPPQNGFPGYPQVPPPPQFFQGRR